MGTDNLHHKRKTGLLKRERKQIKEYRDSILIVCEGEKTEPEYFRKFPVTNIRVKAIGTGRSNISLVEEAIEIWKKHADEGSYFERLWCVFDRDGFPQKNYNQAFDNISAEEAKLNRRYHKKTGREVSIAIAYSNEAFELWYLLHFDYIDTALSRHQYIDMLTKRMNRKYRKNDSGIYYLLSKFQNTAIFNAEKLESSIDSREKHNYSPSTTVHKLVIELNRYLKK